MMEFVNLEEQDQLFPIIPTRSYSIENIKDDNFQIIDGSIEKLELSNSKLSGVIVINKIDYSTKEGEDQEHICIKEDCDVSKYYGCTENGDYFKKENLFSELTDEYLRAIARINLGIAELYALKWGNITGNLQNQKDLYNFVIDSIAESINQVVEEINLKLSLWALEIELALRNKADIFSPNLQGVPTTTLPLMTDNSNRIASTEWVNAKIAAASIDDNVKAISLDPEYMCYGDDPIDVTVEWEYYKDVDSQILNDIPLDKKLRKYTFTNVSSSKVITLTYKYGEVSASRVVTFEIKYPIYFGTSLDYTLLDNTVDNSFTVTANKGEYIYIFIPNGSKAVLTVSSIIGGFNRIGVLEIFGNLYYLFKSQNSGLGETTIEIVNQGNFESDRLDTTTIKELLASKADKDAVYNKLEIDAKIDAITAGDIGLENYYTKQEVLELIPDISDKADKTELPTKVSLLSNDLGYLTNVPEEYVTELELRQKGYLTEEVEPAFSASAAKTINLQDINNWNNKVDKLVGMGLSEESFTQLEKAKLLGLTNYNDTALKGLIADIEQTLNTKADILDLLNKADISNIPTKVSLLENDSGYIKKVPDNFITEEKLAEKGYLTEFTEEDPTVPSWAKLPNKPEYTLLELGAEAEGSAQLALLESKDYTDSKIAEIVGGVGTDYNTLEKVEVKIKLNESSITSLKLTTTNIQLNLEGKADKSEIFSGDYNDLSNTPDIPSIEGLATESYVQLEILKIPSVDLSNYALKEEIPDISGKVDKEEGKGLSTNDFTTLDKEKLDLLLNYDDSEILNKLILLESTTAYKVPYILRNSNNWVSYFSSYDLAEQEINKIKLSTIVILEYFSNVHLISYRIDILESLIDIYFKYSIVLDIKFSLSIDESSLTITSYALRTDTIVNSLTSDLTSSALSAYLGKILKDLIDNLLLLINALSYENPLLLE